MPFELFQEDFGFSEVVKWRHIQLKHTNYSF